MFEWVYSASIEDLLLFKVIQILVRGSFQLLEERVISGEDLFEKLHESMQAVISNFIYHD